MATENEKLRALLAEARQELQVLASYVDDPETNWPNAGLKMTAKAHKRAVQSIDAALAEPVDFLMPTTDAKEVRWEMVQMLKRERDEAQAKREEYASEARSLRARLADERQNYADAIRERNRAEARDEEARAMLSAICSEFEGAVAHADWRAAGSPGMSVPFTGDFASATQLPSVVGRMRWWAREMRKVIGEDKP